MFVKRDNPHSAGKNIVFVPESFRVLRGYDNAGGGGVVPVDYYLGCAAYWRGLDGGKMVVSFGYVGVWCYDLETGVPLYAIEGREENFWENGVTYSEWLRLSSLGVGDPQVNVNYEMTNRLGKNRPYDFRFYGKKFFPGLEDFYDGNFHQELLSNPDVSLPVGTDGWFKWSERSSFKRG